MHLTFHIHHFFNCYCCYFWECKQTRSCSRPAGQGSLALPWMSSGNFKCLKFKSAVEIHCLLKCLSNGFQMVQFECPKIRGPIVIHFYVNSFLIFSSVGCRVIRNCSPSIKLRMMDFFCNKTRRLMNKNRTSLKYDSEALNEVLF